MSIINDGINLGPNNNSGFGMLRINSTSLGGSVVLPLTITSFNAEAENGNAKLNWNTVSEINTNFFDIEKSVDGITFEKIGEVKATGMGTLSTSYRFTDYQLSGISYYRLKNTDNNGSYTYSKTVVVKNNTQTQIVIAPNPASSVLVLRSSKKDDYLTVTTESGAIKMNLQLTTDNQKINVQDWPAGIYYAKISNSNTVVVQKFIVIK